MVGRVFALALPVLAQQALILVVGLSDRYLAGHMAHDRQAYMAAHTTASYIAWFISSYTVLVSVGATAVVARCMGASDRVAANRATHQAIVLALAVGAAGAAFGLTLTDPIVRTLNLTDRSAEYAATYLRPMFALLPFQVIEAAGIACLVGAGDTRTGLMVQTGVAVLNLPLAWTMCFGIGQWEGLGFIGIALGTATSYLLGACAVMTVLAAGRAGLHLRWRRLRPDLAMLYRLLRISVPAAADSLSVVGGQFLFLRIVNHLGDTASAAHGAALGWEALAFQSSYAFGIAAMTLVGQNLGARRPHDAGQAGWTAFAIGCTQTCLMGLTFYVLARPMAGLFTSDAAVVDQAVQVMRLIALATPALAATIIFTQALRGAGDTRVPVLFTWFGFLCVRIPLAYWLVSEAVGFGLYGAWLAMCADLYVRGLLLTARFISGRWKLTRV